MNSGRGRLLREASNRSKTCRSHSPRTGGFRPPVHPAMDSAKRDDLFGERVRLLSRGAPGARGSLTSTPVHSDIAPSARTCRCPYLVTRQPSGKPDRYLVDQGEQTGLLSLLRAGDPLTQRRKDARAQRRKLALLWALAPWRLCVSPQVSCCQRELPSPIIRRN